MTILPSVLSAEQLDQVTRYLDERPSSDFVDGRLTASGHAKDVKNVLQLRTGPTQSEPARRIMNIIANGLIQNERVQSSVYPRSMSEPLVYRYETGMEYAAHHDLPSSRATSGAT